MIGCPSPFSVLSGYLDSWGLVGGPVLAGLASGLGSVRVHGLLGRRSPQGKLMVLGSVRWRRVPGSRSRSRSRSGGSIDFTHSVLVWSEDAVGLPVASVSQGRNAA